MFQQRFVLPRSSTRAGPSLRCRASVQQPSASVRRLIMLRHGDSLDAPQGGRDFDRKLSPEGLKASEEAARLMKEKGWIPDCIVASSAHRSRETLDVMIRQITELEEVDTHALGSLYTYAALDGQTRIHIEEVVPHLCSSSQHTVLLVGHNKGWEEAASEFAGTPVRLKGSWAALLEGSGTSWEECFSKGPGSWKLVGMIKPGSKS